MENQPFETVEMTDKGSLSASFLYKTLPGRVCLRLLIRPTLSKFMGFVMDRKVSALTVKRFVRKNKIDMTEYKKTKYASFNDFFTRELKEGARPASKNERDLTAPCDGKLIAFRISENSMFKIKGSMYDVEGLLQDKALAKQFNNGVCLIFRLMPDNYHRYCYIDDGDILSRKKIKGVLHTVRPIAMKKYRIYKQNAREYEVLQTKTFGKTIQMEVGALFVGRIKNFKSTGKFTRGEEKGMFEFGGSTVVMLFQQGAVKIDETIFDNTANNKETVVKMGFKIGEKNNEL